jgi:hypothetical protein
MNKYYREYMMECGWGVMMGVDIVEAMSRKEARKIKARQMYCNDFERIEEVPKHLKDADTDCIINYYQRL